MEQLKYAMKKVDEYENVKSSKLWKAGSGVPEINNVIEKLSEEHGKSI